MDQLDKETRESLVAALKEMAQESTNTVENLLAMQVRYPGSLGDLRPAIDAQSAFQRELKRFIDDLLVA